VKFKFILVSSFSLSVLFSFVGCGGSQVDTKTESNPTVASVPSSQTDPGPSDDTAQTKPKVRRTKKHFKKTINQELESLPLDIVIAKKPLFNMDLPEESFDTKPKLPPSQTVYSIARAGQQRDDFLKEDGYPVTMNQAMMCRFGHFSDGTQCFIFFNDGHYEAANGNNRDLLLPYIERLEAEYKIEKAEKSKKPHKKFKIPGLGKIEKGLTTVF
jgi:hypothetical protein